MSAKQQLDFYSEEEMAEIMRIKSDDPVKTLRSRRSRGTSHPPYVMVGRQALYPKDLAHKWFDSLPVTWEVRHVS